MGKGDRTAGNGDTGDIPSGTKAGEEEYREGETGVVGNRTGFSFTICLIFGDDFCLRFAVGTAIGFNPPLFL